MSITEQYFQAQKRYSSNIYNESSPLSSKICRYIDGKVADVVEQKQKRYIQAVFDDLDRYFANNPIYIK